MGTGPPIGHGPLESLEGSNQAGARRGLLESMEGSDGPLPNIGGRSGALTRSGSREFKGRPRDNKTIGSVQLKLSFPRSIDKTPTGACGVHQATAPGTQLVGCDGDWPAYRSDRALSGKNQLKTNLSVPCNSAEFFSERNFPSAVKQPVVTEYRCF